jgi:hypothetical protein
MANKTKSVKQTRASKAPSHETHGALPIPQVNLNKMFGISDGYDVDTLEDYSVKLEDMTTTELHDHSHRCGIIPLDARDKLIASLKRKFQETKAAAAGPRVRQIKMNPAMSDFHRRFMAGDLQ